MSTFGMPNASVLPWLLSVAQNGTMLWPNNLQSSEPLDLSVKPDRQPASLGSLCSLLPYWNALLQTQSCAAPSSTSAAQSQFALPARVVSPSAPETRPSVCNTAGSGCSELHTSLRSASASVSRDTVAEDAKFTDYNCSCGKRYNTVYHLTRHLCETGHKPVSSRDDGNDIVKLVRGQDMWLNNETEQTRQILRCMQCKMSCANLTELILHMVSTKHFAEIVYGSSSIAERYKFSECIFQDNDADNDADADADADVDADNDADNDADAAPLPSMINGTATTNTSKDLPAKPDADIEPDSDPDAALDSIDVIGDASECSDTWLSSRRRKRHRSTTQTTSSSSEHASKRTQLLIIREDSPAAQESAGPNALHSLSKFCESMRFEPASLATSRVHTPWNTCTSQPVQHASVDCARESMQVLVPGNECTEDKQDSSPLRSLEKFVQKSSSTSATAADCKSAETKPLTEASPHAQLMQAEPSLVHPGRSDGCKGRPLGCKQHKASKGDKPRGKQRPAEDRASAGGAGAGTNGNNSNGLAILKKCVCEYCHKRFANKGQVRLHLSKNKCAVLLACFGHQRLQKMSASTLLSGSRAMVLNSLLYNAASLRSSQAQVPQPRVDKQQPDLSNDAKCCSSQGDLVDRFAKYYDIARSLTGNSAFSGSS